MVDLGEGPGGRAPLFWIKKKEITEGRKAGGVTFVNLEFGTNYGIQVKTQWPSWFTLGRLLVRML